MARLVKRLTALKVKNLKKPGYYADGAGLYLQIALAGSKSWVFRFTLRSRTRDMGLGSCLDVSLEDARNKAAACRATLDKGQDPIAAREALKRAARLAEARALTFDDCANAYIEAHRTGWRNAKHAAQWNATLATYASPIFGKVSVQDIDTDLVMKALDPIWHTKTETASRLRGRIESVLDWATVRKYRVGDNPARWRGQLDKLLPKPSKVTPVKNHPALPYHELPQFMEALREREGVSAKALEFIILTAARASEAVNATWDEIDLDAHVWTIPEARMKAAREHRVPLAPAAVKLLRMMADERQSSYVFPGWKVMRPLTIAATLKTLKDMGRDDLTVHGFRSTFRDWVADKTGYPRELAEMALSHKLGDRVEAAYQRSDLLVRRAHVMDAWAKYCSQKPTIAHVTPIRKRRA